MPLFMDPSLLAATYTDDTAFIVSDTYPQTASVTLLSRLDTTDTWLKRWNIMVNLDKSNHCTFALRRGDCPPVTLDDSIIHNSNTAKDLGIIIDRRLTWKPHLINKRAQMSERL